VRDEMVKFQRAGIQPFGVNPAGVDGHVKYATKLGFNFPLLSDPDRAIARAYRALKDDGRGIQRTVYVVARNGSIAFAQRGAPPVDEIVAAVAGAKG
jgi:thioredoxin-dependent peroxiredoxin